MLVQCFSSWPGSEFHEEMAQRPRILGLWAVKERGRQKEPGTEVYNCSSSWEEEITMHGRTDWAKYLDARQWRQHLAKVCGGLAAKAPEDDETEFVRFSVG